jgi:hypothetical protein
MPKKLMLKAREEISFPGFYIIKEFSYGHQNLVLIRNKEGPNKEGMDNL